MCITLITEWAANNRYVYSGEKLEYVSRTVRDSCTALAVQAYQQQVHLAC